MLQLTDDTSRGPGDLGAPGPRARLAIVVFATVAAALLIPSDTPAPRNGARTTPTTPPIFALLEQDPAGQRRIAMAREQLVTDCMARAGLQYDSAVLSADGESPPDRQQPFGPETMAQLAPVVEAPAAENPNLGTDAYLRTLYGPPAQRVTVQGDRLRVSGPATGCVAEAAQQLLGDDRTRWMQVQVLLFEAAENARRDVESDGEFRAATRRWQDCMRETGIVATDPVTLFDSLSEHRADLPEDPTMIKDIRCKQKTGYLTTAYARLSAAQTQQLAADPSLAADWTRLFNRQHIEAREVLEDSR